MSPMGPHMAGPPLGALVANDQAIFDLQVQLSNQDHVIKQLRDHYHRQDKYIKRLEAQIRRERLVVDFAKYWYKARGMHKAPWLGRLRIEIIKLMEAERINELNPTDYADLVDPL